MGDSDDLGETRLSADDSATCARSASRLAVLIAATCEHLPGDAACRACVEEGFEVYLRRLTFILRRCGVGLGPFDT